MKKLIFITLCLSFIPTSFAGVTAGQCQKSAYQWAIKLMDPDFKVSHAPPSIEIAEGEDRIEHFMFIDDSSTPIDSKKSGSGEQSIEEYYLVQYEKSASKSFTMVDAGDACLLKSVESQHPLFDTE